MACASLILALGGLSRADEEFDSRFLSSGTMPTANVDGTLDLYTEHPEFGSFAIGSFTVEPIEIEFAHRITSSPAGPGWLLQEPTNANKFSMYLESVGLNAPIAVVFDPILSRFDFPDLTTPLFLQRQAEAVVSPNPGADEIRLISDSKSHSITFSYSSSSPVTTIEWYQFARTLVKYGGSTGGGEIWSSILDANNPIRTTSNGGENAEDVNTMQGLITGDGSTTYVDARLPGNGDYIGGGGDGSTNLAGRTSTMSDAPDASRTLTQLETDIGVELSLSNDPEKPEDNRKLRWIRLETNFTTYIKVNGQIRWKICWTYSSTRHLDPPGPDTTSITITCNEAASSFSVQEAQALSNFQAGNYHGG